jgi:hypothetical protein
LQAVKIQADTEKNRMDWALAGEIFQTDLHGYEAHVTGKVQLKIMAPP